MTVDGSPWLVAAGDAVEVRTTCGEEFARDVCDALEQAYATFLRRFPARRPASGKQRVVLLSGRAEYDEHMKRVHGTTVLDPATYRAEENVLLACDCVHKDEATRMRGLVRQRRGEVEELRRKIAAEEERNRKMIEGTRKEVIDNIAEERKRLHREGRATPEALRELEGQKRMALGLAEQLGKVMTAEVAEERKKAEATIRAREEAIRHDELLLRSQNRMMFERLFHESFHAFASSRLSGANGIPRWLDEGMASYFEASTVESGDWVHGAPNAEMLKLCRDPRGALPRLGSVLRDDGKMLSNRHEGRLERSAGAYAVSWALAHYLSARMTAEQMDAYLTAVAGGADAADALAKALGQPLGKIDEAVRAHVASMK